MPNLHLSRVELRCKLQKMQWDSELLASIRRQIKDGDFIWICKVNETKHNNEDNHNNYASTYSPPGNKMEFHVSTKTIPRKAALCLQNV